MSYIDDALRTKSDKFYGNLVELEQLRYRFGQIIYHLQALDDVKKALYYGKNTMPSIDNSFIETCAHLGSKIDIDILHAAIGAATESGEMLEQIYAVLFEGKEFDPVNFKEEIFDQQWYHAIACKVLGITFEEGQANNIAKLKARFPEKFSEHFANNRDLENERWILENIKKDGVELVREINKLPMQK